MFWQNDQNKPVSKLICSRNNLRILERRYQAGTNEEQKVTFREVISSAVNFIRSKDTLQQIISFTSTGTPKRLEVEPEKAETTKELDKR